MCSTSWKASGLVIAPAKNSRCSCGSGKKYKRCCGINDRQVIHLRNRFRSVVTRLVMAARRINKLLVLFGMFFLVFSVATYIFAKPYLAHFSGSLTRTDAVHIVFKGTQKEDISPVCGCMLP